MIEYLSDYHFRLRFMLALRPEVLEYIIKTHSMSVEHTTLTQIRSACEDFKHSNEYGKQLAATKARLGGAKPSNSQNASQNQPHIRSHTKAPPHSHNAHANIHTSKPQNFTAWLNGEDFSKNPPACTTPKPDSKAKLTARCGQKTETKKISCFNCGGNHYARNCPPENQKATQGYTVRIVDKDTADTMGDDASEYHSAGSQSDLKNDLPPESNNQDSGSKCYDHPEGEQYDPDDANEYPFSSDNDLERVYS